MKENQEKALARKNGQNITANQQTRAPFMKIRMQSQNENAALTPLPQTAKGIRTTHEPKPHLPVILSAKKTERFARFLEGARRRGQWGVVALKATVIATGGYRANP